ncbi:MAG: NB-ARC domain-containing protein [Chloroflexota bacterium]
MLRSLREFLPTMSFLALLRVIENASSAVLIFLEQPYSNDKENYQLMFVTVKQVKDALKQWHSSSAVSSSVANLRCLLKEAQALNGSSSAKAKPQTCTNDVLYSGLQNLRASNQEAATLLEARFLDSKSIRGVANQRNMAESYIYKLLDQATAQLTDILNQQENELRASRREAWRGRLEAPSYGCLIGIEHHQQLLIERCMSPEPPWLLSIEGMGGIGKTSLTHAVVSELIEHENLDEIVWVSAKPTHLSPMGMIQSRSNVATQASAILYELILQIAPETPAASSFAPDQLIGILRPYLTRERYLIVIDNLETVEDLNELLPHLEKLTAPSRFVLTSRERTAAMQPIYRFIVPELGEVDALQLIRQEAEQSNVPRIAQLDDADLASIYQCVGGHPLALRLVVGLAHANAVDAILSDLTEAQGEPTENLYHFIYRNAWDSLDELSQQVLLLMVLVQSGGEPISFMAAASELSEQEVRTGLNQLDRFNLVNVHQSATEVRYSLHSLTRTFLIQQALAW